MFSTRSKFKAFALMVYCATFALVVGCGKHQAKPIEAGPRVSSLYTASNGLMPSSPMAGSGVQMQLTLMAGPQNNQPLVFQTYVNQSTTSPSVPQIIGDTEYVLQALCVDSFCDRVAFLVIMTSYAPGTLVPGQTQGGYVGQQSRYIVGRTSKGFLFRRNVQGQMEQSAVVNGTYTNVSQALVDLGAYN